ncbi:MAG: BON domain-containing protein [Gammaproteobacteria bacterium]|nr:BON domain-containing protein [Gammaproteobacteria bacterium]
MATDKRSVGTQIDDKTIGVKIREKRRADPELRKKTHISVTSMNGIVLLTGQAPTTALRNKVLVIARNTAEVRQVVNEIKIEGKTTIASRANDSYISGKVKTKLFSKTKLDATRVKVLTENSNVYLMGLVTREEAKAATDVVRTVGGVVRVVTVFEYVADK